MFVYGMGYSFRGWGVCIRDGMLVKGLECNFSGWDGVFEKGIDC